MSSFRFAAIFAAALTLGACQSAPVQGVKNMLRSDKGDAALSSGVKQYEDGSYADAAKNLQAALDQGLSSDGQVRAHKYLAFIDCVTGRERLCREEFRKALDIDPDFDLTRAEAGHPAWGPVFRSVKARKTSARPQ